MKDTATKGYLAAIIESSDDAIISKDLCGIITSWNPAAQKIFGYTPDEAIGKSVEIIIPEDHLDEEREILSRLRKGEKIDHFETLRRTKSGGLIKVSLTVSPICADGNIIGASEIVRDITATKQSADRQWMLLEAGHVLGSSLEYEKTLSMVCKLLVPRFADWCALDLFTKDEQIQHIEVAHKDPAKVQLAKDFRRRYPPQENKEGALLRVLRTGEPQMYPEITDELLVKGAKDPEHLEMMRSLGLKSIIIVPLIARGHTLGAMTLVMSESAYRYVSEDIYFATELASRAALAVDNARLFSEAKELSRKQEETVQRYRLMQEQLSLLVDASSSLSATLDLPSVFEAILALSGRMIAADAYALWRYNPSTNQWTMEHANNLSKSYQEDGIKGLDGTPELPHKPIIAEDVDKLEVLGKRQELYRKEGIRSMMALPLRLQGVPNGTLVFYYRSSHRFSEMEVSLAVALSNLAASAISNAELYAELKVNDIKKDEFLALLAHELRNPLAPISNAIHILSTPRLTEEMRDETGNLVKRQIGQMTRILDDLLDISRITRGKITLRREPVLLAGVMQTAIETAHPLMSERNQTLTTDLPTAPLLLDGDAARLSQAFSNLLNNAAKYSGKGGKISLTVRIDDQNIAIKIADNGIGIPSNMTERIFEMFSQVDSSMERSYGGLGIGLTLVKSLIEMHGGTISAHSEGIGKGSEFVVKLPLSLNVPLAVSKDTEQERVNQRPFRILVVDDNEASGKTLGWMLEMLGHTAELATEGNAAIAAAKSLNPDAIFLDIGLPGMNGYEVCEIMRKDETLKNTFIVAQTGWGQKEHLQRSKEAGFDHHLVKPVDIKLLEKLLAGLRLQ